jgi:hypothetical protein
MTSDRIKEIHQETAYPESRSVHQALLKVWNECEQEKSYSDEEVYALLLNYQSNYNYANNETGLKQWFEQFKKK